MPFKLFDVDAEIPERKKHVYIKRKEDPEEDLPSCNTKTIPGCMTERGCAFAGAKGVITGAIKDALHVIHSPVGCTAYGYGTKRYPTSQEMPDGSLFPIENFNLKYITGTNLTETDVVFGGMDKLKRCIIEAAKEFPEANAVYTYATCTTGLIGDDIEAVSREVSEEIGKDVVAINAPGFAGPTQSKGHQVANYTLFENLVGTAEPPVVTDYDVNLIGEYNIDGDLWVLKRYFEEMGINVLSTFTGDCCHDEIKWMHRAKLSLVRCQRSATYIARLLEERYNVPYMKVDFFGIEYCKRNLMAIGEYFGIPERAEEVIKDRMEKIGPEIEYLRNKLAGKKVWVFSGGPKNWHLPRPLEDELGMEVVAVSTMFEHEDGYEKIKKRVRENTVIVDDPNSLELEEIIEKYRPDIILSGIKEKYLAHKLGVPCVLIHSYENGPYIGFEGFLNLARDMYASIYSPVWDLLEFEAGD
ncbi:nitrogenase subunit alpha [Methanothermobacter sp. EMTCatA1]|uniref:nitrogenase subunit alpha n=1 Tax=Methanothermobacter sp. EMTCatA1 TaxID=2017966 RepID=UPI000B5E9602|nr:nitrogenase subunit alpha [Methanothermobacter sp. EMTCatA1]MDI6818075.1 nitrogenase subunit alpha [Methanothermobacter thermautotrophicus]BAZ99558.1 Nitrogenase vanadium-iron protein alpha chain [Methanothermobacter sp. EMTCatA1]